MKKHIDEQHFSISNNYQKDKIIQNTQTETSNVVNEENFFKKII